MGAKKQKGNTEELKTILNELLKKSVEEIKGLRTKLFYLRCFVSIYYDLSQYENELIYHQKLLTLFKENKDVFYAEDQAPVVINALECFNKNGKKKDFWEHITHLDTIIKRLSKKQDYYTYWKYVCLFSYYTLHLDEDIPNEIYEKGIDIAKGENYELNSSNCKYMYSVIANYFFVKKAFKKAQEMFDHILLIHNLQPQDLYYFNIKILNIFCYIELGNIKIAQNEVSKLRRKINRDKIENEALIEFLTLLAKLTTVFDVLIKRNLIYRKIYQLLANNKSNEIFGVELMHLYNWTAEKLNK